MLRKLSIVNIALSLLLAQETGAQTTKQSGQIKQVNQLPAESIQARQNPSKTAASDTQPRLPASPKIGKLSELVTKFGAVPNDGKDDTAAIQAAIDAVAKTGGSVLFPPGIYNISIQRQLKQPQALKLRSGIKLAASTTKGATLKLADRQGNYESIMGTEEMGTPLTDFAIQGLTIDSNGQNNPVLAPEGPGGKVSADFGDEKNFLPRTAFRAYIGKRISIDRTRFTNQNAVWSVVVNGTLDRMTDAAITNCRFDNVGGNAVDFDHSSIYTQGSRMLVEKNTFSSRFGPGTKGARTAIEIHGNDQIVRGNTIKGFTVGINVTGAGTPVSQRQLYENNLIDGANAGLMLWFNIHKGNSASQPAMQHIVIRRNTVNISSDKWVEPGIVSDSGPSAGIMLDPNSNAPLQDITIADNRINFVNAKPINFAHDRFSSGITLWKYTHPNTPIDRLTISGNRITNAPGAGIWSNAALGGAGNSKIENNTIVNPARSIHLSGDNSGQARAGIYLQSNSNNKNLRIQNNTISDTLQPTRLKYGIVANSACTGSCSIKQNTVKAPASTPVQANVSWGGRTPVSTQSSVIFTNLGKVLLLCLLFPVVLLSKSYWQK
jgi:Pectate lyase superfamily protein